MDSLLLVAHLFYPGQYSWVYGHNLTAKLHSRVDAPEIISKRVRNMDGLFHPEGTLIPKDELPPYDFVPREYDNYCVGGFPKEVEGRFEKFEGTHPKGIREWFKP